MVQLDIAKIAYCKIYPPIGIARVGDSRDKDGYFFVPDTHTGRLRQPMVRSSTMRFAIVIPQGR